MNSIILPHIGERTYIHSSSFVNCLLDLFPNLNTASIKFTNVSKNCNQILKTGPSHIDGNVYGFVDDTYFSFVDNDKELSTHNIKEPPILSIDVLNRNTFIWNAVANFRKSYQPHFDTTKGQPVIAKIELKNFSNINWPANFGYNMKYTPTRTACEYTYNNQIICQQIGITTGKL